MAAVRPVSPRGASALDRLLVVGLIAGGVVLVWASIVVAASDHYARGDPARALRWDGGHGGAFSAAAARAFDGIGAPENHAAALSLARRALMAEPIDTIALRVLAFEAQRRGQAGRAQRLMAVAGRLSLRDPDVQAWLFEQALAGRDYLAASLHADAVFRRSPEAVDALFPLILAALDDRRAVTSFAARLAERPDWRPPFLWAAAGQSVDHPAARTIYEALAATKAPPDDTETGWLIDRLIAAQDYAGARIEWTRLVPAPPGPTGGLVYNGDFRPAQGAPPFNWRLNNEGDQVAELSQAPGGGALHVQAPATRQAVLAEQLLAAPPGAWRLSGEVLMDRAEPGEAGDRFAWRIGCLPGGDGQPIAEARQLLGPTGWRSFAMSFAVPPRGCEAQWLRLYGLAHDGFSPTQAWYREVRLDPAPGTALAGRPTGAASGMGRHD